MDRRRMMIGGAGFPVVFTILEGAENCRIEIDGKKCSAGNYEIKKGGKLRCVIAVPAKGTGKILLGDEIAAETKGASWITRELAFEFLAQGRIYVEAKKESSESYVMTIREEK